MADSDLTLSDIPDEYLEVMARELQFSVPWQYDADTGSYVDPDTKTGVSGANKDDHQLTRAVLQEQCFDKATRNPQVATAVRDLVGRLAGYGFGCSSEIPEIQAAIEETELDDRNRLWNYYPKYAGRALIEGELFLCLAVHPDGFVEVDFIDPAVIDGSQNDAGIIFHPTKTAMPLVYHLKTQNINDNSYVEEQIPSIYLARHPEWIRVAQAQNGYSKELIKGSQSPKSVYKPLGGFYRFVISWDRGLITKRNIGHIRTVLKWVEYYENLKQYEIDWKKSVGAYVWAVQFTDAKSWIQWMKLSDADRRKTAVAAKKTPGSTMVLGPNMELKVVNPNLPHISESDTDILHMVTSGLNEPEDVATGQSKGTFASVKASRGPMSDRISDEIAYFERFLRHEFWASIFFLKSAVSSFPKEFDVREAVGFNDQEPVFRNIKKKPEMLVDINFPSSEINDMESRARAVLGVKHAAITDTAGIPMSEAMKKLGFGNYARLRLQYETEKEKYPPLPLVLDAESIQEQVQAEPARDNNSEDMEDGNMATKGVPKKDGSGKGQRANQGRGGTPVEKQQKVGKGQKMPKK